MTTLELAQQVRDILHDIQPTNPAESDVLWNYRYRLVPACAEGDADTMYGLIGGLLTVRGLGHITLYDRFYLVVKAIQDYLQANQLPLARDLWNPSVTMYPPAATEE